jgi:hypothetical protein
VENELYVVSLIHTSERAAAVAAEVLGNFAMADLLQRIGRFGQAEDRLAELATRIRAAFHSSLQPAAFTGRHLEMLVDPNARSVLAGALGCQEQDVVATLFDSGQLASALRDVEYARGGDLDAEQLLLPLLSRMPMLAARHGLDTRDWGGFIEDRGWLTPLALNRLTEVARRMEWPHDTHPTGILAGLLEGLSERTDIDSASRFDALALIELRRRIVLLAEQLRTEAMQHASDAARLAPDLISIVRLPALIELYERNSVAVGLHQLFTGTISVADLLKGSYTVPPVVTGEPDPDENLQLANEITLGAFKRRIAFDITCAVDGQRYPQVVLQCRGILRESQAPIRATIQQLRGSDLSARGKNLGERLLNTRVAQHEGLPGFLRLALHEHWAEAIQCIVLTGNRQPIAVPSPWHEYLTTTLPYQSPPSVDARLSALADVILDLRASVSPGRRIEEA